MKEIFQSILSHGGLKVRKHDYYIAVAHALDQLTKCCMPFLVPITYTELNEFIRTLYERYQQDVSAGTNIVQSNNVCHPPKQQMDHQLVLHSGQLQTTFSNFIHIHIFTPCMTFLCFTGIVMFVFVEYQVGIKFFYALFKVVGSIIQYI